MRPQRSHLVVLLATGAALAAGGLLHLVTSGTGADLAWMLAGLLPLVGLLRDIAADLRRGRPGVDVIALVAVAAALVLGESLTAAVIGLMLATGRFLEGHAAGRAEQALTSLLQGAPREGHRVRERGVETVPVEEIVPGDRLLVKTGEVLPVDGVVTGPWAVLDESALTGEPLPVEHEPGDTVSSGAVNAGDPFELRAGARAEESTYAGIVRLVREARDSRSPTVRLADRWAAWFVPLALLVAGTAWAASGDPVRGLAVLVVATPCPLLLAVPVAIVSGVSRGARRGIVFRGGAALEALAGVRNLLVDKTGTLTNGAPSLLRIVTFGLDEGEALRLAASADQVSTHLLARALVAAARDRQVPLASPEQAREVAGAGVEARVEGRAVRVGKVEWLVGGGPEPAEVAEARRRLSRVTPLTVFLSVDGTVRAVFTFDDAIRPDAAATIRALRRGGIERIVMATGDDAVVAGAVGTVVGVDEVLAECSPSDKVEAVRQLRTGGATAVVGDGINDAPALAAADVGVAMGARGASASSEAAGVVLVVDRLQRLAEGMDIARRSRRIALQSVVVGMGLSSVAMGVASVGLLAPIGGALLQEAIDLVAILNALRALRGKRSVEGRPRLSREVSDRLRREHDRLMPRLDSIREAADRLDEAPAGSARVLEQVDRLLAEEILPHEAEDEREVYPHLASLLEGDDPLAAMSRAHGEIFHLVGSFRRIVAGLPASGPEAEDVRDLRRVLYGLHAVLRLHFDQEEELYLSLEPTPTPGRSRAPGEVPERAEQGGPGTREVGPTR